jgi:hypothetical protein
MPFKEAIDSMNPEEFDSRLARRSMRRHKMLMSFLNAVITLIAVGLVFSSIEIFTILCGDDAWPAGLIIGLIFLYFLWQLSRYSTQLADERGRQQDEEDAEDRRVGFYS